MRPRCAQNVTRIGMIARKADQGIQTTEMPPGSMATSTSNPFLHQSPHNGSDRADHLLYECGKHFFPRSQRLVGTNGICVQYSPFSQRVQIALEEAKAEYTSHSVNPALKAEWYTKVNPNGQVSQ